VQYPAPTRRVYNRGRRFSRLRCSTRISSTFQLAVLKLRIEGEDAIRLADVVVLTTARARHSPGGDDRELRFRDGAARDALRSRRFVSMAIRTGGY